MKRTIGKRFAVFLALIAALIPVAASASISSFIGPLNTVSTIASTVPNNGDVNPYGAFIVPTTTGALVQGDIMVSNFNNSSNLQGTGTTLVEVAPDGSTTLFAQIDPSNLPGPCLGGVGLTTALVVLNKGWVIVGSLPTTDGTAATAKAGCLLVLDSQGQVVETFSGAPLNGPWDMTVLDQGSQADLFVTNVLNGTVAGGGQVVHKGTIVRIDLSVPDTGNPTILSQTVIGSGFAQRTDPDALVIGATGVGLGSNGTLYVADTLGNRVAAIGNAVTRLASAGIGRTVSANGALKGPLGLAIAPNNDIIVANGGDGNLVELRPNNGTQVAVKTVEPLGAGTLFGLAVVVNILGVYFVDDGTNTLNLLH